MSQRHYSMYKAKNKFCAMDATDSPINQMTECTKHDVLYFFKNKNGNNPKKKYASPSIQKK